MSETPPAPAPTPAGPKGAEGEPAQLPDDHPLVKTLAAQKDEIKTLRAKAHRLDEIEDAQKSEAQKAVERIAELEQQTAAARSDALRFKVAAKYGIGDEDADLFLMGADEATLTRQAERLAGRSDASKTRLRVPREGTPPGAPKVDEERAAARKLFGRGTA